MTDIIRLADELTNAARNWPILNPAVEANARAALQSAVEALQAENEKLRYSCDVANLAFEKATETANAFNAKLKEQKPVGEVHKHWLSGAAWRMKAELYEDAELSADLTEGTKLYTAPKALEPEPVEPVAWFAFGDSNGPVPLELFGWDEKDCKHAVLTNARAAGWKGTLDGYLYEQRWTIKPVYTHAAPKALEPLTAGQIIDLAKIECRIEFSTGDDILEDQQIESVIALARAIEAAHGIGGQP